MGASRSREVDHRAEGGVEIGRSLHDHGAVVHEHDLRPPRERPLDADVDGGGLQLREEDVVPLGCIEVLRETGPVGQPCTPPHHLASMCRSEVFDLPSGDAVGGGGGEEHPRIPYIGQWNRDEVGDQELRLIEVPKGVGSQRGEILGPGERAGLPW